MASWQYLCVSCGETHAAVSRPGGVVYLRCVATHKWAWYEPSSFSAPTEPKSEVPRVRARVQRAAAGRRTRGARARGPRRAPARKAARPVRK